MNFFQQLFDLMDGVDVTIQASRINGKLNVKVLPKTLASIKCVELSGTPEDMEDGFFAAIINPLASAKGLKVETEQFYKSLEQVQKENQEKLKAAATAPAEKATASDDKNKHRKNTAKAKANGKAKHEVKKPVTETEEPALF